jgi:hypothetical protein
MIEQIIASVILRRQEANELTAQISKQQPV